MQLAFIGPQRKVIRFEIEGNVVRYFDDMWYNGIQLYPMQKENVKNLLASRSPRMQSVGLLIADANHGKNLEEYKSCKSEEDLANMIKRDCKLKGLKEIE